MLTHPATTKEKLMRTAMDIVAGDGFAAATTANIAERAGFAEGTLYRHFKSKDELLIAAYRQLKADVFDRVSAETGSATDPKARLAALWRGMWTVYAADMSAFIFGQRFAESALSKAEGGAAHERMMDHICGIIEDGQKAGLVREAPREMLVGFFFPPLVAMLKQLVQGRAWSDAEIEGAIEMAWASWTG